MRREGDYSGGIERIADSQSGESSSLQRILVAATLGIEPKITESLERLGYVEGRDYYVERDMQKGKALASQYPVVITDDGVISMRAERDALIRIENVPVRDTSSKRARNRSSTRRIYNTVININAGDYDEKLREAIEKRLSVYAPTQTQQEPGRKYKLLIIEDEEHQRELYRQELGDLYELVMPDTPEDAAYAIENLKDSGIDLIVADQGLWGGVTGLQLLAQARESNPEIFRLLYTGNDGALTTAREEGHAAVKRSADLTGLKDAIASLLSPAPRPFKDGTERGYHERLSAPLPDEVPSEAVRTARRVEAVISRELSADAIRARDAQDKEGI
jgi:CheY-like chemotaxis protein